MSEQGYNYSGHGWVVAHLKLFGAHTLSHPKILKVEFHEKSKLMPKKKSYVKNNGYYK